MSTITTILWTDQPVNSRAVINTNFANLNSTKKEDSMSTNKILWRSTAGTWVIEEITVWSGLSLSAWTLSATWGGTWDVVWPASATDNAIARFDTTTGKLIQNSTVTLSDTWDIAGVNEIQVVELRASTSAWVDVHNNSGTQVAIFGAGGSTGSTLVGNTNVWSESADYHQISGGTWTITDTATWSSSNININVVPKWTGRFQVWWVNVPTISSTDTLTNKRITKRVTTETSNATPSINSDNVDIHRITALAVAITSVTITWTPTDWQLLWISITDNWTARAITWWSSFESSTVSLPTTTSISTRLDVWFVWNTVTSKWRCIASA